MAALLALLGRCCFLGRRPFFRWGFLDDRGRRNVDIRRFVASEDAGRLKVGNAGVAIVDCDAAFEEYAFEIGIGHAQASGADVGVILRAEGEAESAADVVLCEEHAAAFASAVAFGLPFVGVAVGDHGVGQDAVVSEFVTALELADEFFDGLVLRLGERFVVIAGDLDADGDFVDLCLVVPHAQAAMVGGFTDVDNAVDLTAGIDEVVAFAIGAEFVERADGRSFRGVENDVLCGTAQRAFSVAGTEFGIAELWSRKKPLRHEGQGAKGFDNAVLNQTVEPFSGG